MENQIHKSFKIASYLIFAAILIDLIVGVIHSRENANFDISIGIETSLMFMTLGYFAFIGKHWVKWVVLFVTVLSTIPLLVMPDQSMTVPFALQLFSGFLKITSILLLFLVPKQKP
ncbi:hypothetical protein [Pedobacter gandavensis]|uniref:Uncharacterized protein n=1 Tax=Pedobacter gandavensis TaxID=2679963 RepID=A0ABR6EUE0_9SPHI|nr:hypothetical protein [Pedobacter gandavensis]MBB2148662.1 hypothetical protein [Pedobacter gandavensis]